MQDHELDYTGMKISVLPPTQLVFTVIELTIPQQILQKSTFFYKGYHHNTLFYSHCNYMLPICIKGIPFSLIFTKS